MAMLYGIEMCSQLKKILDSCHENDISGLHYNSAVPATSSEMCIYTSTPYINPDDEMATNLEKKKKNCAPCCQCNGDNAKCKNCV